MKKTFCLALTLTAALGLSACGGEKTSDDSAKSESLEATSGEGGNNQSSEFMKRVSATKILLDEKRLQQISDTLKLKTEDMGNRRAIESYAPFESFSALIGQLGADNFLSYDFLLKFGGASGLSVEEGLKGEELAAAMTGDACIYSGPTNPKALVSLLRGKAAEAYPIVLTYNKKFMQLALDTEEGKFPVLMNGQSKVQLVTLAELEELLKDHPWGKPKLVGKSAEELFGNHPFQNIAPE